MKKLAALIVLFAAAGAQAQGQKLYCQGIAFRSFSADIVTYAGGTYLNLENSTIVNGFREAKLICANHSQTIEGTRCVGFWNNSPNLVVEVSFKTSEEKTRLTFRPLTGEGPVMQGSAWDCAIEN